MLGLGLSGLNIGDIGQGVRCQGSASKRVESWKTLGERCLGPRFLSYLFRDKPLTLNPEP